MKRFVFVLSLLCFVGFNLLQAQGVQVSGKVTGADDGAALPGVSVVVRGTTIGAVTDFEGNYSITAPDANATLMFSFVGMLTQEVPLNGQTTVDVVMESTSTELDEVVVTALGVSREKKSLGYSIQEVDGGAVNDVPATNFTEALSGKLAGVHIKQSNTMGGANNVVIRGSTSLTGSNQAMFVIDGIPVDNSNIATGADGWGGYDYGNAASDINPNDIESISVLKGAAASALYGSRAANGVILITTKKGKARKGVGVSVNSNFMVSTADKSTLPQWQNEYGAGYGPFYGSTGYFFDYDVDGDGVDDLVVPTSEDASWGAKFDPNLNVVHWDALDPTDDMFGEKRPWVYPGDDKSMPSFFETGTTWINNIAFDGGNKDGSFRLSYTNHNEKGILPNSEIKKNTVNFSGSYKFTKRLTVNANVSYMGQAATGRYGTGYDAGNVMQSFGQWIQTNLDFDRLKNYISPTGMQRTWNYNYMDDLTPIYFDNPYWVRYKNYENDMRNRILGYVSADYQIADWLTATLRTSIDSYTDIQNERIAKGSNPTSDFTNYTRTFREMNTDLMLKFNKDWGDVSLTGLVGANYRDYFMYGNRASTVGGLSAEGLYTVANSVSPASVQEWETLLGEQSLYANASVGYKRMIFLEGTARMDQSSSLIPAQQDTYVYPSIAASFILSELGGLKDASWLSFAKVRLSYAQVGAATSAYRTLPTYDQGTNWGSMSLFSVPGTLPNAELLPEKTNSLEAGLQMDFFLSRLGFDLSVYQTASINQIMPVDVSRASGYNSLILNGGEIDNKGIELAAYLVPVQSGDFSWRMNVNWFLNRNTVVSLPEGIQNYQIYSNWDVSVNARVGEPYGDIQGTDYVWTNGKKTVNDNGYLAISDDILVTIGNIQPDWNMGIGNTLSWKGLEASFLIDIQKGGDLYSINTKYGQATGVYAETAGNNPKGNPQRDPVDEGGGNIFADAVKADGSANDIYVPAFRWGRYWYYNNSPTARFVYDASYVKLREVSISYSLPGEILGDSFIRGVSLALVGRNLWIIHKNVDHFDPEASKQTSGNLQGIESGAYPTARTIGLNLRLNF